MGKEGKLVWLVFLFVLHLAVCSYSQGPPKVIGILANGIMIDRGSAAGVEIGSEGKVFYEETISGQKVNNYIVKFRVDRVARETCQARIMQKTKDPQIGYRVAFDKPLQPKSVKAEIKKEDEKREIPAAADIPSGKTIEWYVGEGSKRIEMNDYTGALKYFEKANELDGWDPVVLEKIEATKKIINAPAEERKYLEQVNRAKYFLAKGQVDFCFEYLLSAYNDFPGKQVDVLKQIQIVSGQFPEEWLEFAQNHKQDNFPFEKIRQTETTSEISGELAADEEKIILTLKNILFSTKGTGIHTATYGYGTLYATHKGLYFVSSSFKFESPWHTISSLSVKKALGMFEAYLKVVSSGQVDSFFYGAAKKQFDAFCQELLTLQAKYEKK